MTKATATSEIETVVANLGKPQVGHILKLTQFLGRLLAEGGVASRAMIATGLNENREAAVFGAMITSLTEEQLVEFGQILLQADTPVITVESLDLVWLTEALAIWAETANLPGIIKNVQRVVAALKQ